MSFTVQSFTPQSFSIERFENWWDSQNLKRWRPRILIYDHQVENLLHEYNAFSSSNDLTIPNLSVNGSVGQTGSFQLTLRDRERNIDRSKVGPSNKVIIALSKTQYGPWYNIFSGYCSSFNVKRDQWEGLDYLMDGFGSGIILEESLTSFARQADPAYFGAVYYNPNDQNQRIDSLALELLTTTDHLANDNGISIQDRGNFDLSGIATIPDIINFIQVRYQPASAVMNYLAEKAGLFWRVDPYDKILLDSPAALHTSTLLKTFTKADQPYDKAKNLSYFAGPWGYTVPISSQSGFANVLISTSGTESKTAALQTADGDAGTLMHDTDIAQEAPVTCTTLDFITLYIRKLGSWAHEKISGAIVGSKSKGKKGPDMKNIYATFEQNLKGYKKNQSFAITMPLKKAAKTLPSNSATLWVVVRQCGEDDRNTIRVGHNGISVSLSQARSCTRPHRTDLPPESEGQPPFQLQDTSPVYMFALYYNTRVKVVAKDSLSAWRYGEVEQFVDLSWTKDFRTVVDTLFTMLEYTAKPKMIFPTQTITIPEPPLMAGDIVSLVDEKAGLTNANRTMVDVLDVRYTFDANNAESVLGTRYCEATVTGLYDFLAVEFGNVDFNSDLRFDV